MEHLALDHDIPAGERVRETLEPEAREHRVARGRSDVEADGPQDDVVGLTLFQLAGQRAGVDGLVVVTMRAGQAGCLGKTPSIWERIPLARSSFS